MKAAYRTQSVFGPAQPQRYLGMRILEGVLVLSLFTILVFILFS